MAMNPEALAAFDRAIEIISNPGHITHGDRETAARELRDLKTAMQADLTEMQQQIEAGADAVRGIIENWSSGDLANAVNNAQAWHDDVMIVFPDFNWTDDESDDFDHLAAMDGKSTFDHDRAQDGLNPLVPADEDDRTYDPAVMAAERMSKAELLNAARAGQELGTCDED